MPAHPEPHARIARKVWRQAWCTDDDLAADIARRDAIELDEAVARLRSIPESEAFALAKEAVGDAPARIRALWRLRTMMRSDPVALADRLDVETYRDLEELEAGVQRATRAWERMRESMRKTRSKKS